MAAGVVPAAPPKKDHYKYTKATRVILEAACCLPKHRVFSTSISSFLLKKQKTKNEKKQKQNTNTKALLPCCLGRTVSQADWLACPI